MIFEIPHRHTYWADKPWGLKPSQELVDWFKSYDHHPVFVVLTDNSRPFMRTKFLLIELQDPDLITLFKLTWM